MDLAFATIGDVAPRVASGEVSPVDLVESALDRTERFDGLLNCYITILRDSALEAARTAETEIRLGRYRGPLHGIPIAIKDNIETAGVRTTGGSMVLADYVPADDAPAVARLRAAGAIVVGKTNLHELGMGATTVNPHYGPSRNPWNPDRVTGGSSGGSAAAVAAGMCLAALGTDAGGSVRIPAALCGVVGLKQTHGRVPVRGCVGACKPTVDHVGPIARSVGDAALLLRTIAGPDSRDPMTDGVPPLPAQFDLDAGVAGLRIGIPAEHYFVDVDDQVEAVVRGAIDVLARAGATVVDVSIPDHDALRAGLAGLDGEVPVYYREWMRTRLREFGRDVQATVLARQFIPAADFAVALRVRRLLADRYRDVLRQVDLLATPTVPVPAYPIAEADATTAPGVPTDTRVLWRNTILANLTGLPAISVPAGFTSDGLPVGLQLTGRAYDEAVVLRAAAAFEAATDWHARRPTTVS